LIDRWRRGKKKRKGNESQRKKENFPDGKKKTYLGSKGGGRDIACQGGGYHAKSTADSKSKKEGVEIEEWDLTQCGQENDERKWGGVDEVLCNV